MEGKNFLSPWFHAALCEFEKQEKLQISFVQRGEAWVMAIAWIQFEFISVGLVSQCNG